jgi:acyl-CoA thioester hydrolase
MTKAPLMSRSHYRAWEQITTRWIDNDVYGHVNNAVYYHWLDTAVNSWLIAQGLLDIENGDPIGLVVETGCRYARSVSYPEKVSVGLAVDRIGSSSVSYRLGIFTPGEDMPAAEGHFTHVYVDRTTRRPTPLPEAWRKTLATLISA